MGRQAAQAKLAALPRPAPPASVSGPRRRRLDGISAFEEIFEFNKYVGCCSSPLWENKEQKQNAFSHFPFIYFIKNMLIICVYNMYDGGGREADKKR